MTGKRYLNNVLCLLFCAIPTQFIWGSDISFAEEIYPELYQLIGSAQNESLRIEAQQLLYEEKESDLDLAKGQRLPRVDIYARTFVAYETRDDVEDVTRGTVNGSLTVTQPLYHWGALSKRQSIAEKRLELQSVQSDSASLLLINEIRHTYLHWLLAKEQREILTRSLELSERFVAARREMVEIGSAAEQSVLEMEARLLETKEGIVYRESRLGQLINKLKELVGNDGLVENLKGGDLNAIRMLSQEDFNDFKAWALSIGENLYSPNAEVFQYLEEIEDEQVSILQKQHYPNIDFVAGIFSDRLDGVNESDSVIRIQYYAGLQFRWNLFDGWQSKARSLGALSRKRRWEIEKDLAIHRDSSELERLFDQASLNLKQVEARSKRADILERRVALLREEVQRNLVSGTELIEAEIDHQEILQRLLEAKVNFLIHTMHIGRMTGLDPYSNQS